jgi:hypothetical protein
MLSGKKALSSVLEQIGAEIASLRAQLDDARAKVIEECARIADEYEGEGLDGKFMREGGDGVRTKLDIAKSIRALLSESKT